jgi:hypothetical protein
VCWGAARLGASAARRWLDVEQRCSKGVERALNSRAAAYSTSFELERRLPSVLHAASAQSSLLRLKLRRRTRDL